MSLEEALDRNTAAVEKMTEVLSNALLQSEAVQNPDDPTPDKQPIAKETPASETKKAAPPKRSRKKKEPEPTPETETPVKQDAVIEEGEATSLFDQEEATQDAAPPAGAAPANAGSEWYRYTMQLCAQYSAHTGDPAKTQAICHKHKVTDLSKADDYTLSQIALEIAPELGIKLG